MRTKNDPMFEMWCECCYQLVRDYRIIDGVFKCEFCISKEEVKALNAIEQKNPTEITDDEWEVPQSTWYRPPGGGENAA